ncbi:MAG: GTPase Era [Candidatus Omnitrophica bacterium]|nr:GTPase Era [Candidatus Omnitrophota bacterium]
MNTQKKSGFVSILGRPNVGKSTLLNYLVGEKLAGVSRKPQTTRETIRGILTREEGQVVFLDTPGMHEPRDLLGSKMLREIEESLDGADLFYWMILPEPMTREEEKILEIVRGLKAPIFLLVNQVDRFPKPHVLPVIDAYKDKLPFQEIIPISAKTGINIEILIQKTFECLPVGAPLFDEDQISDQNERFTASEIIREKVFRMTRQEIPYASTVVIEDFKDRPDKIAEIHATIVVERESQKGVMIGKRGEMMKRIGEASRQDLERFLGRKVFLKLWVKTIPGWKKDKQAMRELGYGP